MRSCSCIMNFIIIITYLPTSSSTPVLPSSFAWLLHSHQLTAILPQSNSTRLHFLSSLSITLRSPPPLFVFLGSNSSTSSHSQRFYMLLRSRGNTITQTVMSKEGWLHLPISRNRIPLGVFCFSFFSLMCCLFFCTTLKVIQQGFESVWLKIYMIGCW